MRDPGGGLHGEGLHQFDGGEIGHTEAQRAEQFFSRMDGAVGGRTRIASCLNGAKEAQTGALFRRIGREHQNSGRIRLNRRKRRAASAAAGV